MLTYFEFKKTIEKVKIVDEAFYNDLIKKNSKEVIDSYFERYLVDKTVSENDEKYNRISYYVDLYLEKEIVKSYEDIKEETKNYEDINEETKSYEDINEETRSLNIFKLYLNEIKKFKILTKEEEVLYYKNIKYLKTKLNKEKITLENINERLEKYGYEEKKYKESTIKNLENKMYYINKAKNELEKNSEITNIDKSEKMLFLKKLLEDIKKYHEYQTLVDNFINANLRLVIYIAKYYQNRGVDFLDLIQDGNLGLKIAFEKYNINKGTKFSTYATYWIKQTIRRGIAERSRAIRLPNYLHEFINKLRIIESNLEQKNQNAPTKEEIIEEFYRLSRIDLINSGIQNPTNEEIRKKANITLEKLEIIEQVTQKIVSLSEVVKEDKNSKNKESTIEEFIEDKETNVEDKVMYDYKYKYLIETLSVLTKREKIVIILRYGLPLDEHINFKDFLSILFEKKPLPSDLQVIQNYHKLYLNLCCNPGEYTYVDIGEVLGVSRERIRQIEKKSFPKLERKVKRDNKLYGTTYYDY